MCQDDLGALAVQEASSMGRTDRMPTQKDLSGIGDKPGAIPGLHKRALKRESMEPARGIEPPTC